MKILLKWLLSAMAIILTAYLLPGVMVASIISAIWLAALLAIINVLIRPLFVLLTLPINIITLGLFTFVINALLILLAESIIKGFDVAGFWWAMLFSVVLSLVSYVLHKLFGTK